MNSHKKMELDCWLRQSIRKHEMERKVNTAALVLSFAILVLLIIFAIREAL